MATLALCVPYRYLPLYIVRGRPLVAAKLGRSDREGAAGSV